jgi:Flp pilus assembly protein TadD
LTHSLIQKIKHFIALGDFNAVNSLFEQSLDEYSNNSDFQFEYVCFLIQTGRAQQAINILNFLLEKKPNKIQYLSKLGTCYAITGSRKEAIRLFKKILIAKPDLVAVNANLALALAEEGRYKEALVFAQKGLELDPKNLPLYSTQALILKYSGQLDAAIKSLNNALSLDENNIQVLSNLSGLLIENNKVDEAKHVLRRLIKLAPLFSESFRVYSTIIDSDDIESFIAKIDAILQKNTCQAHDVINYSYALGRLYEKNKKYKKSFHNYKRANDEARKLYQYDIEQEIVGFENIKAQYTSDFIHDHQPQINKLNPIFILGMPRSGTSLVEQILASHSNVYGAGELNSISLLQQRDFDTINVDVLAQEYMEVLQDRLGNKSCFTDKMPLNFKYIGFLKCLFPNAKIINCRRNVYDTVLSIYKTKFSGNLPFAQNLEEIVQYYKLYEEIMTYWHEIFPNQIYDLSYENLVDDPKKQVEQLLKFCDLEWQDDCLSFYKNDRAVTTASAMQVRKPIYKTAVGYWKNYEEFLSSLDV